MKKIFFYTDTPIYGGAERIMLLLAKNLDRENFKTTLICSNYEQLNPWCVEWKKQGLEVIRLKVQHKHDPRHYFQLRKLLKQEKPDLLHIHLWNPGSCRYAFLAAKKTKTPIITTEHDPFPLQGIKNFFKKKCISQTNHTIAVSKANQELLTVLYPELKNKISTIHNAIDLQQFDKNLTTQQKNKIRRKFFQAGNDEFITLSIAALHPRKGLRYLIKAFSEVAQEKPRTKLVIVGEGPEKPILEQLIKDLNLDERIILLGHQRDKDIPLLLKSSDLFVLPSIKEAFGLVLLEAMAAQKPIIASRVGGIPEIIQDQKNGILIEPKNIKELKNEILRLISNKALREKLSFIAHYDVKQFDVKKMKEETEALYNKILS